MSTDSLVKSPEIANFFSLKAEKRKKRFHASTLCRSRRFPFALLSVNNAKEQIIEGLFAVLRKATRFPIKKTLFLHKSHGVARSRRSCTRTFHRRRKFTRSAVVHDSQKNFSRYR